MDPEMSNPKGSVEFGLRHIYMEPREMALMNLFAEQQWTPRHREQAVNLRGGGGGEMNGECAVLPYVR